ncbi:MAG: hypothetical protein AAB919_02375 [Patescibacteria group bacterium]
MGPDNSGYIRTVMPERNRGWQNSHFHKGIYEIVVVQSGWVGVVDLLADETRKVSVYRKNDMWIFHPEHAHNIYMAAGAVTHCIKHGDNIGNPAKNGVDWYDAPEKFDKWTKLLSEENIFRLAGLSPENIKSLTA